MRVHYIIWSQKVLPTKSIEATAMDKKLTKDVHRDDSTEEDQTTGFTERDSMYMTYKSMCRDTGTIYAPPECCKIISRVRKELNAIASNYGNIQMDPMTSGRWFEENDAIMAGFDRYVEAVHEDKMQKMEPSASESEKKEKNKEKCSEWKRKKAARQAKAMIREGKMKPMQWYFPSDK